MNALLQHTWGASASVDRIWSHVVGMRPSQAVRRNLLVIQAYMDESWKEDGYFVIAGHITDAESWANFSAEWEQLLPYGVLNKYDMHEFKMIEMLKNEERTLRIPAFYKVIEKYVHASLSCVVYLPDLEAAFQRVSIPGRRINWNHYENKYYFTFRILMDTFHTHFDKLFVGTSFPEPVDFIFDDTMNKKFIFKAWDRYIELRPSETQERYGATPRFENDQTFLPLQAADLWAGWVRKCFEENNRELAKRPEIGNWKSLLHRPRRTNLIVTQDDICKNLIEFIKGEENPPGPIVNTKVTFSKPKF